MGGAGPRSGSVAAALRASGGPALRLTASCTSCRIDHAPDGPHPKRPQSPASCSARSAAVARPLVKRQCAQGRSSASGTCKAPPPAPAPGQRLPCPPAMARIKATARKNAKGPAPQVKLEPGFKAPRGGAAAKKPKAAGPSRPRQTRSTAAAAATRTQRVHRRRPGVLALQ